MIIDSIGSSEGGMNGIVARPRARSRAQGRRADREPRRDIVVLDDDLKPIEPGTGVIGRLARGGNIPLGYYKDEAKTAATFVDRRRRQALRR